MWLLIHLVGKKLILWCRFIGENHTSYIVTVSLYSVKTKVLDIETWKPLYWKRITLTLWRAPLLHIYLVLSAVLDNLICDYFNFLALHLTQSTLRNHTNTSIYMSTWTHVHINDSYTYQYTKCSMQDLIMSSFFTEHIFDLV